MPYDARVIKVMIASPGDVPQERQIVRNVLADWNAIHSEREKLVVLPVGWETHSTPQLGDRPQAIINKQVLKNCDLLVGVFWTRLGSPTGEASSGTVEEIQEHIRAGKPVMLYFSSAPVQPASIDPVQYAALTAFRNEMKTKGLVEFLESLTEFQEKLSRQLAQTIHREYPALAGVAVGVSPQEETEAVGTSLSKDAGRILAGAKSDGTIMRIRHLGGFHVQAGTFNEETADPRREAEWESALKELEDNGLIEDRGHLREVFRVTAEGYRVADLL